MTDTRTSTPVSWCYFRCQGGFGREDTVSGTSTSHHRTDFKFPSVSFRLGTPGDPRGSGVSSGRWGSTQPPGSRDGNRPGTVCV